MCLKNMDYTASTDALQQERVRVQALKPWITHAAAARADEKEFEENPLRFRAPVLTLHLAVPQRGWKRALCWAGN